MSRTRIVKGLYNKITHGDHSMFSKENINSFASLVKEKGEEDGVSYGVNEEAPVISPNVKLKRFLVHFRRPQNFDGNYGFDWLREEYIYPMVTVTNDNNGTPINAPTALCKNPNRLKQEYLNGAVNNISPYSVIYYPAWLAIFPHTSTSQFAHGSTMHRNGVNLDLQFDELDQIISDGTEILFESQNQNLRVSPQKIAIADIISTGKKSRTVYGKTINYYKLEQKINVKCVGGTLNQHTEIKIFAKLDQEKVEVGKLMVYKNNVIPKAEIVVVNVITGGNNAQLKDDYQYIFKNQSFNQALIRAEVKVDSEFDINSLPNTDQDVINFKQNMKGSNSEFIKNTLGVLYDRYGKHKVSGGINGNQNKKTYLFLTSLTAGNVLGSCSIDSNRNWGNFYIVYNAGLKDGHTIMHECGHSLSLPHVFQEGSMAKHTFYHGYTDNYMDYTWKAGNLVWVTNPITRRRQQVLSSAGSNPYKNKMYSFFKWQWDIMRGDRSLTNNY